MLAIRHPLMEAPAAAIRRRSRLFGVLALVLSGVIFAFGVIPPLLGGAAQWTPTPCTIIESYVESRQETEPWGNSVRMFTLYLPYVRYTYTFEGALYESTQLSIHGSDSDRDPVRAQRVVDAFPPDSVHTCYVDPDAPHVAVLIQRETRAPWLYAVGGAILALFGVAGLLMPPRPG
jgi:hypothetical protein